ncbi:M14 family metallopeptidase [Sungkyunkwania multivorans]|uniref:M14 family metallopeptidase n=1 Tax=Sungkyunkwania multivorans TaxID=1173618 RepID=A0ABW3D5E1_9FLAO
MKKLTLLLLFIVTALSAQKTYDLKYFLPQSDLYNQDIPTPKSVLGYEVGKWHVTHDKLVEYMKTLAATSDRITIEDRGTTFEDRPLLLLTITSPKNHQRIEAIRQQHLQLTESSGAELNIANMPIVVQQGFSIHGNEPSGANASLLAAYHLAAAQGPEIERLLENVIILFDPSYNPDGLQRFAYWANTNKSQHLNSDNNDREFHEVWPGGRTNHYWFDMNRDWLPVQLPESRVRIATFHKWLPNILTDHHEMGTNSTFFFQPGVPDRTHPLTPKMNQQLTKEIAKFHAKALDKIGSLYYSEENYDDFYYGKGSTFPDINGSIGILFEQGSSRGHLQESANGLLAFPFTIRNQLTTALSTLEAAQNLRTEILGYQRDFYKNARNEGARTKTKAIVFGDEKDAAKTFHLAEILKRHQIDFHEIKNDFTADGKRYKKGSSYIIPTNQKNHRLINAMFEKRTKFKDSLFYDISAWSFPLAFNLDHTNLPSLNNAGAKVTDLQPAMGSVSAKSNYAYLFEWHEYYTPKALNMILEKGLRAKQGMTPFDLQGNQYDYGTIMIPVQNQELNSDEIYTFLQKVAKESHIKITAVTTGLTNGIDLGSNEFRTIKAPKVAMIVGRGINAYDAGEIWHLFDTRYDMQITKIDTEYFNRADLHKYNVIILPNTQSGLNNGQKNKLNEWVRKGGTLIGFRNAARWLSNNGFIKIDYNKTQVVAKDVPFEDAQKFTGAQVIGGAIFEAELDRSHPINFGYKNKRLPLFRNTRLFIRADSTSYRNPIKYTGQPLLSGYISEENLEQLKHTVPFKSQRLGRGKVIIFTDNTNFRAFWYGTNKLLMNAVFFRNSF